MPALFSGDLRFTYLCRMPEPEFRMPLGEHLEDLRRRLVFAMLGLLPIVVMAFVFGDDLLAFVLAPATRVLHEQGQGEIQSTGALETFSAYMRISFIAAIVVGSPWLLYQLWRFVAPGLHKHEKRFVYFLLPLSAVLTTTGVVFLFMVVLPLILKFLVEFGTGVANARIATAPLPEGVVLPQLPVLAADPTSPPPGSFWLNEGLQKLRLALPMGDGSVQVRSIDLYKDAGIRQQWRVSDVMSMMLTLILAFAGAFQAPIIVLLLGWAGVIDQKFLRTYRRHAMLVCAVIAAAVMPGDPASMISMMVPLYVLYELGGVLLRLFPVSRVKGAPASPSTPPTPLLGRGEDEDDRP
jgi:sec-independent protein translocase protein TatC